MMVVANNPKSSAGFTLIELVVIVVFVAVAMVPVIITYNNVSRTTVDPLLNIRAINLSQAYLDEVQAKRFDETSGQGGTPRCGSVDAGASACTLAAGFGSDAGESRVSYDDVDDYHGLNEQPPLDSLGNPRPGYENYLAQINISYAGNDLNGMNNTDAKRIDVSITTPKGHVYQFTSYRVNF